MCVVEHLFVNLFTRGSGNMKSFLQRKGVTLSPRDYCITALSFMALGLFSSLIIGLIIKTIGEQQIVENLSPVLAASLTEMGQFAMDLMGGAIGIAVAYSLKAPPIVLFSTLFAGTFGAELGGPVGS